MASEPKAKAKEITIKNKLVLKDMGDPSLVKLMTGEKAKYILGTIFGIATGVRSRANRTDPTKTDDALLGDFEGISANPDNDTVRSGVLYLPEGMHNLVATQLVGENASDKVAFAIEVASVKATNAAGYTWAFTPKMQATEADPLKAMRDDLSKDLPKYIAPPAPPASK